MSDPRVQVELGNDLESPRVARRLATELTAGLDAAVVEAVLLVVTELVGNAVRHTAASCRLVLALTDDCVYVEVADSDASTPIVVPDEPTDESGRGLRMVREVSRTWGVVPTPSGKVVWCEVAC